MRRSSRGQAARQKAASKRDAMRIEAMKTPSHKRKPKGRIVKTTKSRGY